MRKAPTSSQEPHSELGVTGLPPECLFVEVQPSSAASGDGASDKIHRHVSIWVYSGERSQCTRSGWVTSFLLPEPKPLGVSPV